MPAILIYAAPSDVTRLAAVLQGLDSLALLETDNGHHWRANRDFKLGENGRYPFWCFAAGPLLLVPDDMAAEPSEKIADPYAGWFQNRGSIEDPYFGNQPNIIYLNVCTAPRMPDSCLGLSSLEWIGNYFWALERKANSSMMSQWSRLGKLLEKATFKVPRGGMQSSDKKMACAFPDALAILNGQGVKADTFSR